MYQSQITNIIIRLKKAKNKNPELTLDKIVDDTGVSESTVKRVFKDGSEEKSFRYETLKPLCLYLLGTDGLDEEIDTDEMQLRLAQLKEKYEKKLEQEREQYRNAMDFLKDQISKKDARMDILFKALEDRAEQYKELKSQYDELLAQHQSLMTHFIESEELINQIFKKE